MNGVGFDSGGAGILYGVNTWGNRDHQFSLGMGHGFIAGEGFGSTPTFTLSTMHRSRRRWSFISENWVIPTGDGVGLFLSAGGRYLGQSITLDVAGFIPIIPDAEIAVILPWLSVGIPWGRRANPNKKKSP